VDVRQPKEYERTYTRRAAHPVGELADRLRELDPDKPTITY
jgi:rhodanese-related sulfurtransferase